TGATAELLVKALDPTLDGVGIAPLGEQPLTGLEALIHPAQDRRGLAQGAAVVHQHWDHPVASRAPGVEGVEPGQHLLLHVGQARAVQRPARLLTVVADGDGDQAQHRGTIPELRRPGVLPRRAVPSPDALRIAGKAAAHYGPRPYVF